MEWSRKQGPDSRLASDARAAFANTYEVRYARSGCVSLEILKAQLFVSPRIET